MTYAEARAALEAVEAEHERLAEETAAAWRVVLDAREVERAANHRGLLDGDPSLFADIAGRPWTTDGACIVSQGWPLPGPDPEGGRTWLPVPDAAALYFAAAQTPVDEAGRFAPRFAATLRAGRVVGLAAVEINGQEARGAVAVLDDEGAIRAVVMPYRLDASPETPHIRADGSEP